MYQVNGQVSRLGNMCFEDSDMQNDQELDEDRDIGGEFLNL